MEITHPFVKGEYLPLVDHEARIYKYRRNELVAKGNHEEVFLDKMGKHAFASYKEKDLYLSANFAGLVTRKSADFLFGEVALVSSGKPGDSVEQKVLDRISNTNNMERLNYQQALTAAMYGECFYKIRFGQSYSGAFPESYDPKRIIIEAVDPKKVYPQTHPLDKTKIIAYHIAEEVKVGPDKWELYVETHRANKIEYRRFKLDMFQTDRFGNVHSFKIGSELPEYYEEQETGVPLPLVVHIANYSDGLSWQGMDDISEHMSLFSEINNRLSQIASILDKHADPILAVPAGVLQEDADGNTYFNATLAKVFEVMGKDDIIPQYVTNNNPQLEQAFRELELLVEFLLSTTEIPAIAVGLKDSGTSGSSGLSIKWRMNSLLAKINRKRQFFDDGLKQVYMIAQMLEQYADPSIGKYEIVVPKIKFKDGLPQDDTEMANRMSIRTNGSQTMSRKTAMMIMDGLTEEQAEEEMKRIEAEEEKDAFAEPSIFNDTINSTINDTKDSTKDDEEINTEE